MAASPTSLPRSRRWVLAVVLWAFGLATTTLLLGLWGRTVTTDEASLTESAQAAITTDTATDRITGWIADAIGAAADSADPAIGDAVERIAATKEAERAVDLIVADLVAAALAEPGEAPEADIASDLAPVVPLIVAELSGRGVDVSAAQVDTAVAAASSAIVESPEVTTAHSVVRSTRSFLTIVLVVGIAALILFASLAVALADEPLAMIRSLANRLAVSALTFVVVLRLGAWAIDPDRGRSPLPRGGSVLLGSNHLVLFTVAAAGLAVALTTGIVLRNRRRQLRPTRDWDADSEDDTVELVMV